MNNLKPSRNASCPCGSGKKYKRCCINSHNTTKQQTFDPYNANSNSRVEYRNSIKTFEFAKKYKSSELLKVISCLQLYPQNHGKTLRLEFLINAILNAPNLTSVDIDYQNLQSDFASSCKKSSMEDPPEDFFTDTIAFINGPNIVYPGPIPDSVNVTQKLINAVSRNYSFPGEFAIECMQGVLFILSIHSEIAGHFRHTTRMYEEIKDDEIYFPPIDDLLNAKEIFSFSRDRINAIYQKYNLKSGIIESFTTDLSNIRLEYEQINGNPLFKRPFVRFEDDYLLLLPTSELVCINEFIISTAKKYKVFDRLMKCYDDEIISQVRFDTSKMRWRHEHFDFKENQIGKEFLWKFDTDKHAYVLVLNQSVNLRNGLENKNVSTQISQKIDDSCRLIKHSKPGSKILTIVITSNYELLGFYGFRYKLSKHVDEFISLSYHQFEILLANWDFDSLSLWKYVKYLRIAEKSVEFSHFNSHLSKFYWYQTNYESFFDPNNEPATLFSFDFSLEGDVRRNALNKIDRVCIPGLIQQNKVFLQCIRREKHWPVYISEELRFGQFKYCLLKYKTPIWISSPKFSPVLEPFMSTILYWLNELHASLYHFLDQFEKDPILFEFTLEKDYEEIEFDKLIESLVKYEYIVEPSKSIIRFTIPETLFYYIYKVDNSGEIMLMEFILEALSELAKSKRISFPSSEKIQSILQNSIPLGKQKMLLLSDGGGDLRMRETDVEHVRYIQKSDISHILQNIVPWLNYREPIPARVTRKQDKTKLFNAIVTVHLQKLANTIARYDCLELLMFLMKKHESLLQTQAWRKLITTPRILCYDKYFNVEEEFAEEEAKAVELGLSLRVLIEFVLAEFPKGYEPINNDTVDLMLSHVIELINNGAASDAIMFDLNDPEMGLLPSGRIGVNHQFQQVKLQGFREYMYGESIYNMNSGFKKYFPTRKKEKNPRTSQEQNYIESVQKAFLSDWGITLERIYDISICLTLYSYNQNKSILLLTEDDIYKILTKEFDFTIDEITSFLKQFSLKSRNGILNVDKKLLHEIYPWRYNRLYSYIRKPVVNIPINGKLHYLISVRHLLTAAENTLSVFDDGRLKITSECKLISSLLAKRNDIKGKEFRTDVYEWLKNNTRLSLIEHEVKIKRKGFFNSETDKGDIDILAIDYIDSIIYSIECKNTSQAKVAYDFKRELDYYLGNEKSTGHIEKHVNRHSWLVDNKRSICQKLNIDEDSFEIKSLVITNNIMPPHFTERLPLPIISFYELKANKFTF